MEKLMQDVISAMTERGFEVTETATEEEACATVLSLLKNTGSVGIGGSMTVKEMNLVPLLQEQGIQVLCHTGTSDAEKEGIRRSAMNADVYLCSANAVTRDGKLVLTDGLGNRLGAVCYGPKHVIFVIGQNKLVDGGYEKALARIKTVAAPLNAKRLGLHTACAEKGSCAGNACGESICRLTLCVDRVPMNRRISVVLVRKNLGY